MIRQICKYLILNFTQDKERQILWLPVLFACGIGIYFYLPQEPSKWFTLGLLEVLIFVAVLIRYRPVLLKILGFFAIVALGFAWIQLKTIYVASQMGEIPDQKTYIKGRIIEADKNSKGFPRLTLDDISDFNNRRISGLYRISLRDNKKEFEIGQCIELVASLKPRATAQLVEGYDFSRKTFYNSLTGGGFAETAAYLIECPTNKDSILQRFRQRLRKVRQQITSKIQHVLPPSEAAIASAIITGNQSIINKRTINSYRDSGLAHFLSISGLHMSMVAGLMFFLVRLFMAAIPSLSLRYNSKKCSVLFAVAISIAYLLISGAGIPVQRAFIMTIIIMIGILFDRRAISMNTISWAAFFILLLSPEALISASFQMSFAAVVVLVAFYEKISTKLVALFNHENDGLFLTTIKVVGLYFLGIIVADILASFATLPFAIYHFNRVAVYTGLANLLAGPVIGFFVMPSVLLALMFLPFSHGFEFAIRLVGYGIKIINDITLWVSSLDGASQPVLSMPFWGFMLIVLGGLWLCIWEQKWRWWGGLPLIIGMASLLIVQNPDAIISEDLKLIGLKDPQGKIVILPRRGKRFAKDVWYEKTASQAPDKKQYEKIKKIYKGQKVYPEIIDIRCDENSCVYKNRLKIIKDKEIYVDNNKIDLKNSGGIAIYFSPCLTIKKVKDYIGNRIWNSQ